MFEATKVPVVFDWTKPTAILIGRYQPPHAGHLALVKEALKKTEQVAILIRQMPVSDSNPFTVQKIGEKWAELLLAHDLTDRVVVLRAPNISHVFYGRDVGYKIEYIDLPPEIQAISATQERAKLAAIKDAREHE